MDFEALTGFLNRLADAAGTAELGGISAAAALAVENAMLLAVAAPVAAVLGASYLMDWAQLLTSPDGVDRLVIALAAAEAPAAGLGEQRA